MRKLAVALALSTTALASPALARDHSWYVGVEGGPNIVEDIQYDIGDQSNAGTVDSKYGYTVDGVAGYDFGAFRLEAEVGYQHANVDGYSSTVATPYYDDAGALHGAPADASAPQPPDGRFVGSYLGYLLGQASHAVYRDFENAIAAQGLTHIAWRVLAVLHDAALSHPENQGAIAVGQLAHDVLAKQPTVTKLVQRMAEDGLLALLADPADQRRTLVAATAEGRRIAAALIEQARAQESHLLSRWSAHEADTLKRHLQRLASGQ